MKKRDWYLLIGSLLLIPGAGILNKHDGDIVFVYGFVSSALIVVGVNFLFKSTKICVTGVDIVEDISKRMSDFTSWSNDIVRGQMGDKYSSVSHLTIETDNTRVTTTILSDVDDGWVFEIYLNVQSEVEINNDDIWFQVKNDFEDKVLHTAFNQHQNGQA